MIHSNFKNLIITSFRTAFQDEKIVIVCVVWGGGKVGEREGGRERRE